MTEGEPDSSLDQILSRITDGVVELDEEFRCEFANSAAEEMLHPEEDGIQGSPFWDVSPGDANALRTKIEYAVDTGARTRIKQRDNLNNRHLAHDIYPDDAGATVIITERPKPHDQADQPSDSDDSSASESDELDSTVPEQLLEDIFEFIPIHFFVKDTEARHMWVSQGLVDNPDDLVGKRDTEIGSSEMASFNTDSLADDWQVLEEGKRILNKEEYNEELDKRFLTSKVPRRDEDGNIIGLIGYSFEITEQKEREQSLTELQRQTRRLMDTSTIEETAEVAVQAAGDILDAPLCGAYRVEESGQTLSPVEAVESFPEELGGPPTYSRDYSNDPAAEVVWDVFDSGEKRELDTVHSVDGLAEQTPAESALLYPLGDHGMFIVSALEPEAFDEVQKRYFELLAMSLETAFERVEREQQQHRRARQLRTLHKYSRQLTSARSYQEAGDVVLETIDDLTELDGAGVYLADEYEESLRDPNAPADPRLPDGGVEPGQELIPVVAEHPDGRTESDVPTLGPESIAWDVYQSRTEYWTDDVREDDRRYAEDTEVRSEAILPLGKFGILIVGSLTVDEFDRLNQSVCRVLAANLTVALDQIHNRQELEQSRDLLSRTEQLADAGGWLYDTETETLEWTDGTRAIHEVSDDYDPTVEDALGFYHPDDRERVDDLFTACVETGETFDDQFRLLTAEETLKWVRVRGEAVMNDGETVGIRGTVQDVTEQRSRARQLERQRDNLEILNEVVRHDVRNNLAVIGAYADALEDHVGESGHGHVETIREQVRKATDLTESARDLAEVLLQTDPNLERTSVGSVLEEEIESIRSSFSDAVVTVETDFESTEVLANEMLGSVFRNLLKNAIQHNDKQVPEVAISGQEVDGMVEVRVADNGPGIPDEIKDRVFEEGEKGLDSGGSGIGLYLVESLVAEFDGSVQIEDNDPEGTVFVVRLPVADRVFGGK